MDRETDVLVVGSGIAGLTFALEVAREHRVLLVTKKERAESSTNWARGGIAAVLGEDDDPPPHRPTPWRRGRDSASGRGGTPGPGGTGAGRGAGGPGGRFAATTEGSPWGKGGGDLPAEDRPRRRPHRREIERTS